MQGNSGMTDILTNGKLRRSLHNLYVASFKEIKTGLYPQSYATRLLTTMMAGQPWSWQVIGITPRAFEVFASNGFKTRSQRIHRGHRQSRADTAKAVFGRDKPMALEEFFEYFLRNDETVLMTPEENKANATGLPDYIPIDRALGLFVC